MPKVARQADQPIAALIEDLKSRGLLEDTLVLWGGEFGRTPVTEGPDGRDHNPYGYTMWMAGAGIKKGSTYGRTHDYGYYAIEDKVHVHDLHATILHLLGLDHTKLTYPYAGRNFRLTNVQGDTFLGLPASTNFKNHALFRVCGLRCELTYLLGFPLQLRCNPGGRSSLCRHNPNPFTS